MNKNTQTMLLTAVLLLLSTGAAIGLRSWLHPPLHLQAATLLPELLPESSPESVKNLQGYQLTYVGDTSIDFGVLRDRWILLFFGYTACPNSWPQSLQELSKMMATFDGVDAKYKPKVFFVYLDHPGDASTARLLQTYGHYFHADIAGLTGHNDELARLTNFFDVPFRPTTTIGDQEFLVQDGVNAPMNCTDPSIANISSQIFIMDPQLRYIGSFAAPQDGNALYSDMQQLIHQLWRYHVQR